MRAGALAVVREQESLNRINVFPVPDADTGANLASTLRSAAAAVQARFGFGLGQMARTAADAALDGARGNSGAIMAQFFHGLAEALGTRIAVGTREFAAAVCRGAEAAQQALSQPVEGTILSVIREWARSVEEHAPRVQDFRELMAATVERAREALANTPRQLAVLARHNVVDAGAQGFVYFLEGIQKFFVDRGAADWRRAGLSSAQPTPFAAAHAELDDSFRFCTEGLLSGTQLDRKAIARAISDLGASIVVAGGGSRVRAHIHTNAPQRFLAVLAGFGTLERTKIDDMIMQQAAARQARIAVVTDSAADLPEAVAHALHIVRVPLAITLGDATYQDGVDITPPLFYRLLGNTAGTPRTSQPPVGAFRDTYRRLLESHDGIVSIHLSSGMSGTCQAAETAAAMVDPDRIRVVDSRQLCGSLGLVAEAAGRAAAEGKKLDEVAAAALAAVQDSMLFTVIGSLEMAVRGGRVPARVARLAGALRLHPIIAVRPGEGKARAVGLAFGYGSAMRALVRKAARFARGTPLQITISHANAVGAAEYLAERLTRRFGLSEIPVVDAAIVLAAHVGPGSVAVSVRRARR
ncbi:MAG TPA: DegV family protein [Thermoanaerobaculaceae bacterium]|nr:DegV family protein [Thermoanaerobaculaceae bacterium]HRS15999.1 DegV family protein [Thermoanaerobaculaceae bacterium]